MATAIGVVRPLAGLGSMSIKNALSDDSGVFHRPWYDTVLLRLAMAKVRKNPESPKKFGKKFHFRAKKTVFAYIHRYAM